MASKSKIHVVDDKSVLDKLLCSPLSLDTDGLPGLAQAPAVYDLILCDLQDGCVLMSSQAGNGANAEAANTDRDGKTR